MKTAGVCFDFYDDPSAALLKELFPTAGELPSIVKTAHILKSEERAELRDEAFAVVMVNEGKILRKFACVDPGNTALSVLYFEQAMDLMPEEAIKVAAANLLSACGHFRLHAPSFLKEAAKKPSDGMGRTRDSMQQPLVSDDGDWAARTNLVSIRSGNDSSRVTQSIGTMKTAEVRQGGEVGTTDVRHIGPGAKQPSLQNRKSDIVDVTGKSPKAKTEKKAAAITALGRYPLDSFADVKKAVQYFDEQWTEMDPASRHVFAKEASARADQLGIEVPETMARYGSTTYAPDVEAHLAARMSLTQGTPWKAVYAHMREKRAGIEPEAFAELLFHADVDAELHWYWGGDIADPYFSTFGGKGETEKTAAWSWTGRLGDHVTQEELCWLARNGRALVHKHFSSDLTNGFLKDPINVFDSLPDDSKVILARLANGKFDGMSAN